MLKLTPVYVIFVQALMQQQSCDYCFSIDWMMRRTELVPGSVASPATAHSKCVCDLFLSGDRQPIGDRLRAAETCDVTVEARVSGVCFVAGFQGDRRGYIVIAGANSKCRCNYVGV